MEDNLGSITAPFARSAEQIRTAVIPVAGRGTRTYPASYGVPKNMLPAGDKPIIQHAVEEALGIGVSKVVIVCNPGDDVYFRRHFRKDTELEEMFEAKGKQQELEAIRAIGSYADRIEYVPQHNPKGEGHAILQAREYTGDHPFAVIFPDDFFYTGHGKSALGQMAEQHKKHGGNIFAVIEVSDEDVHRYGIMKPGAVSDDGLLIQSLSLVEKPKTLEEAGGSRLALMSRHILEPGAMDVLANLGPNRNGEICIADALDRLSRNGAKVHGQRINGVRFDYGTLEGRMEAEATLALMKDPSISERARQVSAKINPAINRHPRHSR